jgi:predicted DNA-binding transcriptional regulator YafY
VDHEQLTFEVASLDEGAAGLIGCADSVEILEPAALRECLRDIGERLARHHARNPADSDTEIQVGRGGGLTPGDD